MSNLFNNLKNSVKKQFNAAVQNTLLVKTWKELGFLLFFTLAWTVVFSLAFWAIMTVFSPSISLWGSKFIAMSGVTLFTFRLMVGGMILVSIFFSALAAALDYRKQKNEIKGALESKAN